MCNARDNVPLSGKFYLGRLYSHLQGEIQNYFSEDGASNGYIFQRCWMFLQVIPCSWFSKKKKKRCRCICCGFCLSWGWVMSRVRGTRNRSGDSLKRQEQNWPAGFACIPLCQEKSYLKQFARNATAGNSGTGQPGAACSETQPSELLGTHVRHEFCLLKPAEIRLFHQGTPAGM